MFKLHLLVALCLTSTLTSVQAQDGPYPAKDIQDHWVGKTVSGRLPNGGPVSMLLRADGTGKVVVATIPYQGTWRLSETGYCTSWAGIRGGTERCFTVQRAGKVFVVINPDGSEGGRLDTIE